MPANVGTAYVTIMPTTKGFSKALESAGGTAGMASGKAFSGAFGGALKTLGKVGAAGLAAVATGIGVVGKQALDAYKDFEQLSGGAAKIFDELDQTAILADAQGAYKTLNMSANEYLASINQVGATFAQTMGDQKGYDTAKKGMQAISDFASATGLNIGELNEKYKMITRSTTSYQSICDQFAGILPQTNKDFLDQAKAAGFLSQEYESITDVPVAEYQEALTKMLQKSVKEMGLAGNTFAESTETISGSLAMAKSAWSNWLAALGDEDADLSTLTDNLIESIGAVADNVGPRLVVIGQRIAEALPDVASTAMEKLPSIVVPILATAFDTIAAAIEGLLRGLGIPIPEGFIRWDDLTAAWDTVSGTISGIFGAVSDYINRVLTNIRVTVTALRIVIQTGLTAARSFALGAFNGVKEALLRPFESAKTAISGVVGKIKGFFPFHIGKILTLKLPHISISGGSAPWGIGGKGSLPSFHVNWYAKGGIFDSPALVGVGEAGTEAVVPIDKLRGYIADAMGKGAGGSVTNVYIGDLRVNDDEAIQRDVLQLVSDMRRLASMNRG